MSKNYPNLSKILKKLLFDRNMRSADLARELDMPPPTVHRIVTGRSSRPYKSSLETIAKYFNLTINELIGDNNNEVTVTGISTTTLKYVDWELLQPLKNSDDSIVVHNVSPQSFVLQLNDHSMEPLFPLDSILIFDPTVEIKDRSYILVKPNCEDKHIFRQVIFDGNKKFVRAINPDLITTSLRQLNENDLIIAKLIESRMLQV